MDITIVTSAKSDQEGKALLQELGMPLVRIKLKPCQITILFQICLLELEMRVKKAYNHINPKFKNVPKYCKSASKRGVHF